MKSVVLLLLCLIVIPLPAEETWLAGAAKVNITPVQPMLMAGYASRDQPATGTLAPLWAKALVLQDSDGNRSLLLTLDLVGIGRSFSKSITRKMNKKFDFARRDIAICTSHTHTGPIVGLNLASMHYRLGSNSQKRRIMEYREILQNQLLEIAQRAIHDLQPCQLSQGMGQASFAVNRRNNPEAEVPSRRSQNALVGPWDHDVPVLSVRDSNGELKAVVFGYACHSTVLGIDQWSGDYPGFAQAELESIYPNCQAMFWAGCGGDQNPLPRRTIELAKHYGKRLAMAVQSVLLTIKMEEIAPKLRTDYSEIDIELSELPTEIQLEETAKSGNRFEQSRAKMLLEQIKASVPLESTYPYPVAVWNLGGTVTWVFMGGETVVDYSLRLKRELDGRVWVASYSNDVMAYVPSRRVLREGGYEGARSMIYYGLPTTWAPSIEETIVTEVTRQAGRLSIDREESP